MARVRRHKHHSRKHVPTGGHGGIRRDRLFAATRRARHRRGSWRRLESLRISVPSETLLASALPAQAPRGDQRQLRFDIPAAPLRTVLAEIERVSGISIAITDAAIGDLSSPGVTGLFTPLEAITRVLRGTSVTAPRDGARPRVSRDSPRIGGS